MSWVGSSSSLARCEPLLRSELLQSLGDKRPEFFTARERCSIRVSAREHFAGRRPGSETSVEVHRRRRPGSGPARDQRRPRQSIERRHQFTRRIDVERARWISDDVLRLRDRCLHLGKRHASLHFSEFFAAEKEPRPGICVTSECRGIGNQPPVEGEICGHFETGHLRNVLRTSDSEWTRLVALAARRIRALLIAKGPRGDAFSAAISATVANFVNCGRSRQLEVPHGCARSSSRGRPESE